MNKIGITTVLLATGMFSTSWSATIGYWRFENPGSLGQDFGPAARDMLVFNAPWSESLADAGAGEFFSKTIPQTWAANTLGLRLHGSNQLYRADEAAFNVRTQLTVELFFNAAAIPNDSTAPIVSQWNDASNQRAWLFGVRDGVSGSVISGRLRLAISANGSGTVGANYWATNATRWVIETNRDYYVAYIFHAGTVTCYLADLSTNNPALESEALTGFPPTLFDSTAPLRIGASQTGTDTTAFLRFNGLVDEVRVSDRALPVEELLISTNLAPRFDTPPQSVAVEAGQDALFSASAVGEPPLSYRWYHNDALLEWAASPVLVVSNVSLAQSGTAYFAVVSNAYGSITSAPVILTVVDTAAPTVGYWRFENAGSPGLDAGPNALHLNNEGVPEDITDPGPGAFFPKVIPLTRQTNTLGVALSEAHLSRPDELAFLVRTQLTIEAFFNLRAVTDDVTMTIASQYGDYQQQKGWAFGVREDLSGAGLGNLRLRFAVSPSGDGTGQMAVNATRWTLQTNRDYYAAAAYAAGAVTFYLMDLESASPALESQTITGLPSSIYNTASDFRVGALQSGSGTPGNYWRFPGLLDEVRLSRVALAEPDLLITPGLAIHSFVARPPNVAPGEAAELSWRVAGASAVWLHGGPFLQQDVSHATNLNTGPLTQSVTFTLTISNAHGVVTAQLPVGVGEVLGDPVLSEFMTENRVTLEDEDGESSDWIELQNTNAFFLDLGGYYLTDAANNPTKWRLPSVLLPPNEFLVVFASNKNRTNDPAHLHANFKLDNDQGYLALVRPDGLTVVQEFNPYPGQLADYSYGPSGYLATPTPGATNSGPLSLIISNLTENIVPPPAAGEPLAIQAVVFPFAGAVSNVTLHYRVMFNPETNLPMALAGDHTWTATIPPGVAAPGQMIRWRVTALDTRGRTARAPAFLNPAASPEYFGTVAADPSIVTPLPVIHRFVQNTNAAETLTGTRCAVFLNGEFFDNVFTRIRGNTAVNWPKKSYKLDFNPGCHALLHPNLPRVEEINLNTTYTDKSYNRAVLAYGAFTDAGLPTPEIRHAHLRQNGQFFSVTLLTEQVDKDFLRRHGFDDRGALYKGNQGATGETTTPYTKQTREFEDNTDLQAFLDGLKLTGNALENFLFDQVNVPFLVNYVAVVALTQHADGSDKNHFLYRDTIGSGEWRMIPYDLDNTMGAGGLNTDYVVYNLEPRSHPFLGARPYVLSASKYHRLLEAIVNTPRTREMALRRIRTLADAFLATNHFQPRIDQLVNIIGNDVDADRARWGAIAHFAGTNYTLAEANERTKTMYLAGRYGYLTGTNITGIGTNNPAAQPALVALQFGAIEFNPRSANQDEEFIEVRNPNTFAVDVSGWKLRGAVQQTFEAGTVIPAGGSLYLSPKVAAFRARALSPKGGEGLFVQGNYDGHLSNFGETLCLFDTVSNLVAITNYPGSPSDNQRWLTIAEIMYQPDTPWEDAEYLELLNTSANTPLDLTGVKFTAGIAYNFPTNTLLAPGARLLLVANRTAFEALYGTNPPVAGVYSGRLSNDGETLKIEDADNSTILEFTYSDAPPWPLAANGRGHSLVCHWPELRSGLSSSTNWVASPCYHGSPGEPDPPSCDTDDDGIPDIWESEHGLSSLLPDALEDTDGDGHSNAMEWRAGTDPRNPASVLKLELASPTNPTAFRFEAVAERGYTLQWSAGLPGGPWLAATNLPPAPTNRAVEIADPIGLTRTNRFYRLLIP